MIFAMVIGISLTSYMRMASTAATLAQRSFLANEAMNVGEGALEHGLWSFNKNNAGTPNAWTSPTNWTINGSNAYCALDGFTLGQNATATARVHIQHYDSTGIPTPVMVARSVIKPANGPEIVKMIYVELSRRSYFAGG